jgi:D-serine deaminase-like pyridoxal phosphate-dependent protein
VIRALETPAALVDVDRLTRNLDRMAKYCAEHELALRPHVKTHKSLRVANEQVARGAAGLTCATPRESEVMSEVTGDLLLHHPVLGSKLARVMSLPRSTSIVVAVDSAEAIDGLSEAAQIAERDVGVYVEIDLGMHRVGVPTVDDVIALAQRAHERPRTRFAGVTFYPGHIREHVSEQQGKLDRLRSDLEALVETMEAAGCAPPVLSGGSTPLAWRAHELPLVREVRPGTYVYNDRGTSEIGACAWDDCALTVLATVVSTAVPGQAVVDAGSKALGREPLRGVEGEGFGALMDHPEVTVQRMSEEHGILDLASTRWRPRVGDQVRIVPNHVCIVVHLNDVVYGVRGDEVVESWPVSARGRGATPVEAGLPE